MEETTGKNYLTELEIFDHLKRFFIVKYLIYMLQVLITIQLYGEFKEFFPNNAVEYFVSYYEMNFQPLLIGADWCC